jgi:hypothetical protein
MAIHTAAGTTISIGIPVPSTQTLSTVYFSGLSYTAIGEVTNIGDFGKTFNKITHNPIATRYTKKLKGSYDNGSLTADLAIDKDDAGQIVLKTASDSDASYAFRVVENDGVTTYFTAQTMSFVKKISGVDSIVAGSVSLEIDSNLF